MKKKSVVGVVVVSTFLLVAAAGGLVWYQNKALAFESALIEAMGYMNTKRTSFSGELQMLKEPKYQATFKTVINERSSMTMADIKYSNLFSDKEAEVQLISINGKNYIKIAKIDLILEGLPKDPLSRSVASNLKPIVSQYRDGWIQLDEPIEISKSVECINALRTANLGDQLKNGSIKLKELVKLLEKKTVLVDGESASEYQFNVTNLEKVLPSESVSSNCSVDDALFTMHVSDKDGRLMRMSIKTTETDVRITPEKISNETIINEPKKVMKFSDLKRQIDALFLK